MPDPGLVLDARVRLGAFALEAAFSVGAGETLAVVGPNGAGKSTCLGLIAGLLRPDGGSVSCAGETWDDVRRGVHVAPESRRVGMLFQEYALFPHLAVAENVRYGPAARGRSRAEADALAAHWLGRLGLSGLEHRAPGTLSGGQRQRVALARALAAEPRVLLLDEPFGSLDVSTRGALRSELRGFLRRCGVPAVLVTHDAVDALALGDRIAVLEAGHVTQLGSREELLSHPRSPFVAELAGLNLFRVELAAGHGLKLGTAGPLAFHVLADALSGAAFLVFAPSEVVVSAQRPSGSPQNVFEARVVELVPLPDRLRVVLDAGLVLAAEVTHEAAAALGLAAGRVVWASIKATAIRVYG